MAEYAEFIVAVAIVSPLVFTLAFGAHAGWRQERVQGRYVHWRSYDLVDDSVPEPLPPGTIPSLDRAPEDVS